MYITGLQDHGHRLTMSSIFPRRLLCYPQVTGLLDPDHKGGPPDIFVLAATACTTTLNNAVSCLIIS